MLNKFEQAAVAVAMAGPGCGGHSGKNFKVGAVLVRRKTIVSSRHNSYKTHRRLSYWTPYPYLHAEQAAIFAYGQRNIQAHSNLKLFVARIHKDQTLALAKPCLVCQAIIRETNIQEVYYSTNEGEFLKLDLL